MWFRRKRADGDAAAVLHEVGAWLQLVHDQNPDDDPRNPGIAYLLRRWPNIEEAVRRGQWGQLTEQAASTHTERSKANASL